jgi:hypothetical protein
MQRPPGAHDIASVRGSDALMPEAHAENRDGRPEPPHDVGGDAGLDRSAGARREDDMARRERLDLGEGRLVIPADEGVASSSRIYRARLWTKESITMTRIMPVVPTRRSYRGLVHRFTGFCSRSESATIRRRR